MTAQSKKCPNPLAPNFFLNADELRAATFVRHVEIHESLDSTNNRAAELAGDLSIELPALVVARHQTAGRGRGANKWWSAEGALTFSLLLEPAAHGITTDRWPQLSLAAAVAVCDALEFRIADCGLRNQGNNPKSEIRKPKAPSCSIKWPNDVLVAGRKIAGVLLESPGGRGPAKDRLVIGIGINVNNSWENAPGDLRASGIALCDVSARQHNLQHVLAEVLSAIDLRINQHGDNDPQLPRAWQQLNYLADRDIMVDLDGRHSSGRCIEIAHDGALVLATPQGRQRFHSGTVRF